MWTVLFKHAGDREDQREAVEGFGEAIMLVCRLLTDGVETITLRHDGGYEIEGEALAEICNVYRETMTA
ncbi:MAG TPA: hypothetical protein VFA12_16435 [Stellaceae bacterium]|nr:hypothetical protein [Stellaceae bacterium]